MADDIKKTKPSYTLEELAKAIRSAKDPDPGIRVKRGKDRSIPMPSVGADKDTEYDLGDGLKYKPSEVFKPKVPKDGLMLLKKGGSTNKYARGGGIESRGKTKGRFV